jgi:hypothetical protein
VNHLVLPAIRPKTPTLPQAIAILRRHNRWRRGAEIAQEDPTVLGLAIDVILRHLRRHLTATTVRRPNKP